MMFNYSLSSAAFGYRNELSSLLTPRHMRCRRKRMADLGLVVWNQIKSVEEIVNENELESNRKRFKGMS